jgi:antitoxin ParD1/3/4
VPSPVVILYRNNTACAFFVIMGYCRHDNERISIMNVSLGEKWENFVEDKVKSGDYQTASEVLRDGLRLLEKAELLKRISVGSMAELEAKLLESAASLDAGRGEDGEKVFARLRKRIKSRHRNA